ncbi:6956_t:CDS:2 [Scutellospora calospora]|uniref:6956_t:CDS:1 n=1 Tax=Scutellospora calospora TaxID=85575 RepID=A0ACA9M6T3_9GLOM|nr:6956_t:CDS:2 [Scutellospora calospora]
MTSDYRKKLIKAGVVNYWNRKLVSKNIGLYNCLRQIDNKLVLKLEERPLVHAIYFHYVSSLSQEQSINQQLRNKVQVECRDFATIANSSEVTGFWENKKERFYRQTLDDHTRKEKLYLSSTHLAQLQDEVVNEEKDEFYTEDNEYYGDSTMSTTSTQASIDVSMPTTSTQASTDVSMPTTSTQASTDVSMPTTSTQASIDVSMPTISTQELIDVSIPNEDSKFVERNEPESVGRIKHWTLSSGTDVGQVLADYRCKIPESQKCLDPVYWGILDLTGSHQETKQLFTTDDWTEMLKSFEDEIEIIKEDIPDVIYLFFDEVQQIVKNNENGEGIATAIDGISFREIEEKYKITLSSQDIAYMIEIKRAVLTYAENLLNIDLPVSESDFDNLFTNMLTRRFLDKTELKMDAGEICSWASAKRRNEGRSITLRARVGQKCYFRGMLKHSINKLEAIIGLRSGGLPEAHSKKNFVDSIDLSITMRDILYTFFNSNTNAPDEDLHKMFVFGIKSWGWTHQILAMDCKGTNICRFGTLCTIALPNSAKTLACLEKFYVEMKNIKATLNSICNKANDIALSHARAHRLHRRKRNEEDQIENADVEVGGCFGSIKSLAYISSPYVISLYNMEFVFGGAFLY